MGKSETRFDKDSDEFNELLGTPNRTGVYCMLKDCCLTFGWKDIEHVRIHHNDYLKAYSMVFKLTNRSSYVSSGMYLFARQSYCLAVSFVAGILSDFLLLLSFGLVRLLAWSRVGLVSLLPQGTIGCE